MSDRNRPRNNRNNDIDDFFAQFDNPSTPQRNQSTRKSATIHGRTTGRTGSSSARRPEAARPQRQTEYRTSADREAAKAQRRAIANSQSGARRYAETHPSESARRSADSRPSETVRRSERSASKDAPSGQKSSRKPAHAVNAEASAKSKRRRAKGGSGGGSGRDRGKLNALRPPQASRKVWIKFIVSCVMALVMAVGVYVGIVFLTAPAVNTDNILS